METNSATVKFVRSSENIAGKSDPTMWGNNCVYMPTEWSRNCLCFGTVNRGIVVRFVAKVEISLNYKVSTPVLGNVAET